MKLGNILFGLIICLYGCQVKVPIVKELNHKDISCGSDWLVMRSKGEEYVIENDSAYRSQLATCNTIPSVDFTKFTLLGKYVTGSGCHTKFKRTLLRNAYKKEYKYIIAVEEIGNCKPLAMTMNWGLVRKLRPGYRVVFEVKVKKIEKKE